MSGAESTVAPWTSVGQVFGWRDNSITGMLHCPTGYVRDHWAAYSNNGSSCWINGWATEIDTDCRIILHTGIAPFLIDTCNVYIYGHTK